RGARLPHARLRVAALDRERLLPRRGAPTRRAVPAVVLPHTGPLRARAAARRGEPPVADRRNALREPRHALRRGLPRDAPAGDGSRRVAARLHLRGRAYPGPARALGRPAV